MRDLPQSGDFAFSEKTVLCEPRRRECDRGQSCVAAERRRRAPQRLEPDQRDEDGQRRCATRRDRYHEHTTCLLAGINRRDYEKLPQENPG
jgi:hypothetical protein